MRQWIHGQDLEPELRRLPAISTSGDAVGPATLQVRAVMAQMPSSARRQLRAQIGYVITALRRLGRAMARIEQRPSEPISRARPFE
jgi:hypothetical protein